MNRRDDSPGEFHPGNPGFQDSAPDQYGQEHYEHSEYGSSESHQPQHGQVPRGQGQHMQAPGEGQSRQGQSGWRPYGQGPWDRQYGQGQGPYAPGQQAQGQYGQRRGYSAGSADYYERNRDWNRASGRYEQRSRGYGSRGYGGFSQPPFAQQPFGHAPFSHSEFGESNEPRYFGTGSHGYGGGPSFTGGTYGHADARSDSPYFQEAGFNRGSYEDPLESASYPQDWYRRESYPRQNLAYPRGGMPLQRRRYATGPKGYKRSDERLREDISERLMQAYDIDSSEVTVEVLGGKVVLEGTVPDRYMKHAIEDLCDAAPGVEDIENRIRVTGARSRSDATTSTNATASNPSKSTRRDS